MITKKIALVVCSVVSLLFLSRSAFADWVSLIPSGVLSGISTDVNTVVTAFIAIFAVIAGFAILSRVMTR